MSTPPKKLPPLPSAKKKQQQQQQQQQQAEASRFFTKGRLIVWGLIAVLLVVVVVEARAKFQYGAAMRAIERAEKEAGTNPVKLDDILPHIPGKPKIATREFGTQEHKLTYTDYTWQWSGVLRTYTLELQVDEDGEVSGY